MWLMLAGIALVLTSWAIAWGDFPPFSYYTFFPLWLGYILTVNGFSFWLLGKSLLAQAGKKFVLLFLISIPLWWLFELLNQITANWRYLAPSAHPALSFLVGSINFSIVVPAVLSSSYFLFHLFLRLKPLNTKPSKINLSTLLASFLLGILSLFLISYSPNLYFPLLWGGVFFLFEPLNYLLGFPSIFSRIEKGDWTLPVVIMAATLFTGFWWELWNFYSFPKWIYDVPEVGFFKVFEMPILGYLGYPFFGLEVYSFTAFVLGVLGKIFPKGYFLFVKFS